MANSCKAIKSAIQSLLRTLGYKLRIYRPGRGERINDFSTKALFDYFPFWQSKIEINGQSYGGIADYSTQRISILNVSALYKHVDFKGKSILELGPLEGGNTIILSRLGATSITAIEGRIENYIKCCIIKNLLGLENAKFFLDDVRNISVEKYGRFDIALIAGVLYHLDDPHVLMKQLSEVTDTLVISTHYADATSPSPRAEIRSLATDFGTYRGKTFREGRLNNPNAGLQSESFWPFEEDLLRMCKDLGYKEVTVIARNPIKTERFKLIYLVAKKMTG
jgi:hypothetical protein